MPTRRRSRTIRSFSNSRPIKIGTPKVLDFVYKNDVVSVGVFSKSTLEKHRKNGLLMLSPQSKNKYWITKKGIKVFKRGNI